MSNLTDPEFPPTEPMQMLLVAMCVLILVFWLQEWMASYRVEGFSVGILVSICEEHEKARARGLALTHAIPTILP